MRPTRKPLALSDLSASSYKRLYRGGMKGKDPSRQPQSDIEAVLPDLWLLSADDLRTTSDGKEC